MLIYVQERVESAINKVSSANPVNDVRPGPVTDNAHHPHRYRIISERTLKSKHTPAPSRFPNHYTSDAGAFFRIRRRKSTTDKSVDLFRPLHPHAGRVGYPITYPQIPKNSNPPPNPCALPYGPLNKSDKPPHTDTINMINANIFHGFCRILDNGDAFF